MEQDEDDAEEERDEEEEENVVWLLGHCATGTMHSGIKKNIHGSLENVPKIISNMQTISDHE